LGCIHLPVRKACLENTDVDFVVIGEPENTVSDLVEALEWERMISRALLGWVLWKMAKLT